MKTVQLGIHENRSQFTLLVLMNLFVGAMVGIERTILPLLGEEKFGVMSTTAALSFIISFGFSKAIVNYFAGYIADRFGRKKVLILGWVFGLFVPILIIFAPSWEVILFANVLLGINQGLAWSMAVNMKIDLAKSNERGFAVGLNEFAGYSGVALFALISGYLATYSLSPEPFFIGIGIAVVGLGFALQIKDTSDHLMLHQASAKQVDLPYEKKSAREVFIQTSFRHPQLSTYSFAGLATNLKDGMAWGLFPLFFLSKDVPFEQAGVLIALYPASWGFFQLFTGKASDRFGRRPFLIGGMFLQAASLWLLVGTTGYPLWFVSSILLGLGTALVYPTLQAAISDVAAPSWRASAMGVYRLWRDSGYAFGAILAGIVTDLLSIDWAIVLVAGIPLIAGIVLAIRAK